MDASGERCKSESAGDQPYSGFYVMETPLSQQGLRWGTVEPTIKFLLEALDHGRREGLSLLPDVDQLSYLLLHAVTGEPGISRRYEAYFGTPP